MEFSLLTRGLAALALVLPTFALAKDKPPTVLPKTSKWVVDYDEDSCHLVGAFGAAKQQVVARFSKFEPGDAFELVLYGQPLATDGVVAKVKLDFGLTPEPTVLTGLLGRRGEQPLAIMSSTNFRASRDPEKDAPLTSADEAAVSHLDFRVGQKPTYRLDLGSMGPPMAAMRNCLSDLVKHWGYDPQVIAALTEQVRPASDPATWLKSSDYPVEALRSGHSGLVHFRLDVDEAGKVHKCSVIGKTTPDDFEKATCSGLSRRARLRPALDASGKPTKAFYVSTVRWLVNANLS